MSLYSNDSQWHSSFGVVRACLAVACHSSIAAEKTTLIDTCIHRLSSAVVELQQRLGRLIMCSASDEVKSLVGLVVIVMC